jgi:hypothetical protein
MTWPSRRLLPLLLVLLPCSPAHAGKNSDGTTSLSGVVKGASGANVALHLEPVADNPVRYYDGYEAVPRADGFFSFTEIPPGNYRLTVEASGFTATLPADMPSGALTLRAGKKRTNIVITLWHRLSICGHVTGNIAPVDPWGNNIGQDIVPLDTWVTYYRYNPEFGILDSGAQFGTNTDGSFRITDLAPGIYFVKVDNTWYPGTNSFAEAKPVVVGNEPATTCNTDIQTRANYCWVNGKRQLWEAGIDGHITGDPNEDKTHYWISFFEHNPVGASIDTRGRTGWFKLGNEASQAGDSFKVSLCAGEYDVVLSERGHIGGNIWGTAPTAKIIFETQKVTVVQHETTHVDLTPRAKASIEGELHMDKVTLEDFCPNCAHLNVSILREGNGEFQTATLDSKNNFTISNVTPGDYQLFVDVANPDRVFLQSILVDGVAGKARRFTVQEAKPVHMIITLSGDLTQAAGHVSPDVRHWNRWEGEGMRPRASVAGRVLGESNAVYTVRLLSLRYNSNAPAQFTTRTSEDGAFHFDNVPPGVYRLRAHGKNYVRFDYGAHAAELRGTPLLIAPGARIKNLTLNAPQPSSICGRVTDSNGDPQYTLRIRFLASNHNWNQDVSTGEDGRFRVDGLQADDYFLQYWSNRGMRYISGDGRLNEANPIHIQEGKNVGCEANPPLEFHIPAAGDKSYSISGSVIGDLPARLGDRFFIELEDTHDIDVNAYGQEQERGQEQKLSADHRFLFDEVPNGRYRLKLYGVYGPEPKSPDESIGIGPATTAELGCSTDYCIPLRHLLASQLITVSNQDISSLSLTQLDLPTVTGSVHISSPPANWKDIKPSDLQLVLLPQQKNGPLVVDLTGQGNFTIGAADAGEYKLGIIPTKYYRPVDSIYIQSARLDGKEVNPGFFTLPEENAATLEVELGSEMAAVQVHLTVDTSFRMPTQPINENCKSVGPHYGVALLPDPLLGSEIDDEPDRTVHLYFDQDCTCRDPLTGNLQNVPPGKYRAIAAENILDMLLIDPAMTYEISSHEIPMDRDRRRLWSELAAIGKPITLRPGGKLNLELQDKTLEVARITARVGVADEYESLSP